MIQLLGLLEGENRLRAGVAKQLNGGVTPFLCSPPPSLARRPVSSLGAEVLSLVHCSVFLLVGGLTGLIPLDKGRGITQ